MTRHLVRFLALAAAATLLAACSASGLLFSNIAFAYSNAAPMLTWAVDDYIDLNDVQKDWVRERFDRTLAWHRARELPEYGRFLAGFEASLADGLTVEEVRAAHLAIRRSYHRVVEHLLPHMADLLLQLDAEQVEGMARKFSEDNRKVAKEAGGNPEERRARAIRKAIDYFEGLTGTLDAAQRELVASRLRALPDISAERMADRRLRQAETVTLIRARPDREALVAGLRRVLIDTEAWRRPEYLQKLKERDVRNFEMIAALSATLSPEQRAHLLRRVRGIGKDIQQLATSG